MSSRWSRCALAGCLLSAACGGEHELRAQIRPGTLAPVGPVQVEPITDHIVSAVPPEVDVLWVIDDSCSMSCVVGCHSGKEVSDRLTEHFSAFMDQVDGAGIDYHLGVITGNMADKHAQGRLVEARGARFIDATTPDPVDTFAEMAALGTRGPARERIRDAVFAAHEVHGTDHNAGFFRGDASLHTIVISNEDDFSELAVDEFAAWYSVLRPVPDRLYHSIQCTDRNADECATMWPDTKGWVGFEHSLVTDQIGGIVWDVLDPDWSVLVEQLGQSAAGAGVEFFLSARPVPASIEVRIDDAAEDPSGFTYDEARNSVRLGRLVPGGSRVTVTYLPAAAAPR